MKRLKSLFIVHLMLASLWPIQAHGSEAKAKPVNHLSIAQVQQIEQRISKLKPGMSDKQIFSVLGVSKNKLGPSIGKGGLSNYHIHYSLRAGTGLVLVYDFTKKPRQFKQAKIIHSKRH